MCPADLTERLHVFLTQAVGLGRRTALSVLLSPLALWEHRVQMCINTNSTLITAMLQSFHSTPVLLQGGEVGQQAFMVELLQLQEVDGPLVWWDWQLKMSIRTSHFLLKDTNTPDLLTGRRTDGSCQGDRNNTTGGKHSAVSPWGFESKHGQHPETGRDWGRLGQQQHIKKPRPHSRKRQHYVIKP